MIDNFKEFLEKQNKSDNTIKSYSRIIHSYSDWYYESFSNKFTKLFRQNILDYKSYLQNIRQLNAKSINVSFAAIIKYNEFLVETKVQENFVISKKDYIKVQTEYANPAIISKIDVEKFRQNILENRNERDYAIVTLIAYTGIRISEATNLKIIDINLKSKEILIRKGKGSKQRVVILNDKVKHALKAYLNKREFYKHKDSEFLFVSRESDKLHSSVINRIFNKHSDNITPHTLRHFFCSYAIENGLSVHEVASLAGHSNIHTTLIYTNPSKEEIKRKINLL